MTLSQFLQQYGAQGQEKGDGYLARHFEGLSPAELERARDMLLQRAFQRDTVDLDGLRLIGDRRTIESLEAAAGLAATLGSRFDVVRRETLFALTRDAHHLAGLFQLIDEEDVDIARFAADALARHPLPANFAGPIVERLADGQHEASIIPLTKAWMSTQGQPILDSTAFQKHLPQIRAITSAPPAERPRVIQGGRPAW